MPYVCRRQMDLCGFRINLIAAGLGSAGPMEGGKGAYVGCK